jgi:hypothetical protein
MSPDFKCLETTERSLDEYISCSLNEQEIINLLFIIIKYGVKDLIITSSNGSGIGQSTYAYYNEKKFDITDYGAW